MPFQSLRQAFGAITPVTGVFTERTDRTLRAWQKTTGIAREGVANPKTWAGLAAGERS